MNCLKLPFNINTTLIVEWMLIEKFTLSLEHCTRSSKTTEDELQVLKKKPVNPLHCAFCWSCVFIITMRAVDMSLHRVVKCGVDWPYEKTPNCKQMILQLERNEALVTWIEPKNGGISDQFPVIRVKDNYYTMSLRMMKVRDPSPKPAFIIL